MSFQEKSNLAMLAVLAGVFGWYFGVVIPPLARLDPAPPVMAAGGLMITLVIAMIVLSIAAHVVLAAFAPKGADFEDERDKAIERRADARSGYVLAAGVFWALGLLLSGTAPFWVANALLASLAASEIAKGVFRAIAYRRGL